MASKTLLPPFREDHGCPDTNRPKYPDFLPQLTFLIPQSAQKFAEFFVRAVRLFAAQFHGALRPLMLLLPRRTEFWISPMLARFWPVQRDSGCHDNPSFPEKKILKKIHTVSLNNSQHWSHSVVQRDRSLSWFGNIYRHPGITFRKITGD